MERIPEKIDQKAIYESFNYAPPVFKGEPVDLHIDHEAFSRAMHDEIGGKSALYSQNMRWEGLRRGRFL